ncbi:MAG TPA: phenylalanine--tRNA ligase subunit alpha [Actinomycetota bacterium]|nr:phenylalanine--tRNA ligase subunit alpha [Actinomycetota bacterium]
MTDDIRAAFESAGTEGLTRISEATDLASLEEAKIRILGRKSALSRARAGLGSLAPEEKRDIGKLANEVQARLEAAIEERRQAFEAVELEQRWERERLDVTLPGHAPHIDPVHPLTRTIWEIVDIFIGLGYKVAEGPEAELSSYNFDALNAPPAHPSRSPLDTFYLEGTNEEVCLRPQTSPMQMRTLEAQPPPVYVVVPGRCYRRDTVDATHLNGFTQLEGLAVDEGITMGDLKGTLQAFAREIFGKGLDTRLRPHYFPFTEPSAELDVQCFKCRGDGCSFCKQEGWIEVLGCGMVHPFLLEWARDHTADDSIRAAYASERYTGFAFGMGIERIAALAHGVSDIRYFWENDLRFLEQFRAIS